MKLPNLVYQFPNIGWAESYLLSITLDDGSVIDGSYVASMAEDGTYICGFVNERMEHVENVVAWEEK